ncbi:peptidoglycan/xylan/chitin deacetylase (PgdA/CDA1 family) [Catenulispora sp. GAS73]|uniref:polysaccharide deacetylase family protein n=1 Tax=Catenulispora sp. GAS73 TaxID=3156269 RepID=UPI0035163406
MIKGLSRKLGSLVLAAVLALIGVTLSAAPAAAAGKVVSITFDDGPSPYTPQVLRILAQYGVHATFFEVGQNVAARPALTSQVYRQGNSVQNHTWSHPDLRKLSASQFTYQVSATDGQIRSHTGYRPCCLRPPYGAVNADVRSRASALGKKIALWTVDPRDWSRPGTATIQNRVLSQVRPGSVVVLHDGGGDRSQTVAALGGILKTLKARGYTFAIWAR